MAAAVHRAHTTIRTQAVAVDGTVIVGQLR